MTAYLYLSTVSETEDATHTSWLHIPLGWNYSQCVGVCPKHAPQTLVSFSTLSLTLRIYSDLLLLLSHWNLENEFVSFPVLDG